MKKRNILIAAFAMVIAAISAAKAEVAVKKMMDFPQHPGIDPVSNSEYQFPTDDCCGHKVPMGTCMMVCPNNPPEWQLEESSRISEKKKPGQEPDTIGNLAGTSDKISSIDMDKNFSEAGSILDGFYNGSKENGKADSSVVYAEPGNTRIASSLTEKEICNAKSKKIVLSGKVPPLKDNPGRSSDANGDPFGAGVLAAGAVALGLAVRKKGYFSNYSEDAHTVWNYVKPGSSSNNTKPPKDPYDPPSSIPSDPYAVHPTGGAVICVGSSCGLP